MKEEESGETELAAYKRPSGVCPVAPLPQDLIAETAEEIREYHRASGLRDAAAIGRIVLERFYGGRPELWRSHRPDKDTSLRKLAARLRGTLTQSGLRRCVRIHLVALEHPGLVNSLHLTSSHADEVYGLPRRQQELLLATAEREGWNIIALRHAKRRLLSENVGTARPCRGRPVSPPELKAVTRLENALASVRLAKALVDEAKILDPEIRRTLVDATKRLKSCAESVLSALDAEQPSSTRAAEPQRLAKSAVVGGDQALPARAAG